MPKQWTPAEDRKLAKMRNEGVRYKDIAKALGRTEGACHQRAYNMGLNKPHAIDEPVMTREEMYSPEPTTWIGRIKRLLGVSDIGAQ